MGAQQHRPGWLVAGGESWKVLMLESIEKENRNCSIQNELRASGGLPIVQQGGGGAEETLRYICLVD